MNGLGLLIVGIVCLVVAYFLPATVPAPLRTVLNIVGWICTIVGVLLLVLYLTGITVGVPLRP